LGANTLVAVRVAVEVSARTGILRAPPLSYGVTVGGGPWAGSAGLRRKTFHRVLNELLDRWEGHGVREFVVITAHRYEPHVEALLLSLTAHSTTKVFDLHQIDVTDLLEADPSGEHAGELETSLLLHLAPHLVRTAEVADFEPGDRLLRRYIRGRVPTPPRESRGSVGCPTRATAAKGRAVFDRWVSTLSATLNPQPAVNPGGAPG
jgi:creatinine amidohydrolase